MNVPTNRILSVALELEVARGALSLFRRGGISAEVAASLGARPDRRPLNGPAATSTPRRARILALRAPAARSPR